VFYVLLAGPVGLMIYKAINTLDSLFGYRNEQYRLFGWASARLDDLANFIPARLTGLLVPVAAQIAGLDARNAWRIFQRDRRQHTSPNAGHTEAAVAGALHLQLGGPSWYGGKRVEKPFLGDSGVAPRPVHIQQANVLLLVTSGLVLLGGLGLRLVG
jgi:adenosylcobinamide-phosphate synthase